jgi:hypothetical protein
MSTLFIASRRLQSKNPHSRLGKSARIWNSEHTTGNFCGLCRVDVGGKDEAMETLQMTNHLKKAHIREYEAFLLEQNRPVKSAEERAEEVA